MKKHIQESVTPFLLYKTSNNEVKVDVLIQNETLWLNQKQMSELFGVDSDTVSYHLKNIYNTDELSESSTTEKISVVQKEGNREVKRNVKFYNLDTFLTFTEYDILEHKGKVSGQIALTLAHEEYEKYRVTQDKLFISDFDKLLGEIGENEDG